MYGICLTLQVTSALTLRVLPSGILDIISYPFVPPTTLSGWLRRIWMFSKGYDLPETSAKKDSPYYVLPKEIISLGAYPKRKSYIHKTKRKGVKNFKDTSFTKLIFDKVTGPTFQLHTWEYLTTDKLEGYITSKNKELLEQLRNDLMVDNEPKPWGCKLGKEGFAYLDAISELQKLEQQNTTLEPKTLLSVDTVISQEIPVDFVVHNIYRFVWGNGGSKLDQPSPVKGYDILPMALANKGDLTTSWWTSSDIHFPVGLEDVFAEVHNV